MQRIRHLWSEGALLAPAVILLLVFVIAPFFLSGYLSFTNERLIPRPVPSQWVGWRNYSRVLTDPDFWQAVRNTFYFTLMVVPFQCAISLGAALLLNKKLAGLTFFRSVAMLPLLAPITVIIAIWAALYQVPNGFFNTAVNLVTRDDRIVDFLGSRDLAMPAIVLLSAWASFPFQMLIYLAGLQEIPEDRYEAATLEGANAWQQFKAITWPGLINVNIFVLIITTVQAFKLFTQINILTKGGPLGSTNTIINYMFVNGYSEGRIGFASAVSVLFFILVAVIAVIQRLVFKNENE
ncbi:sugar ABC transporter permease [Natronospirillum operosum]|uniref:Sugar ABC transporter permease n=1 Tax=Natronospirillum operosum TaxID=2759953 RepID=A0A4Z0W5L6_9GAMM|nr:sugar ABC transporter permease [Natronospirillum operosum]TGG92902.1 sugar ABC transporter permease [Natronospirillum operosum]